LHRQPSCPASFGGVNCPPESPSAAPSHSRLGRSVQNKARSEGERSPKWIYSAELDKHDKEYEVLLERLGGRRIGVVECGGELVAMPQRGTLFAVWNRENPECLVKQGDRIVEVNSIRENLHKMMKQFRKAEVWEIRLRKSWNREADAASLSHGFPTARWRNREPFIFEGQALGASPPKSTVAAEKDSRSGSRCGSRGDGKKGRDQREPGHETWCHPDQQKLNDRVMTEEELKNWRLFLKGQAGLHSAAMMDRFRFAADISKGAPLCIRGSGTACGTASDIWASDGSSLVAFHNGAIRGVNPSNLTATEEPPEETKKRKKKGADDELSMGESGLFRPKYPIDNSLKSLRKLKREWFPEACLREEEILKMKKEAEVREVAEQTKAMLDSLTALRPQKAAIEDGAHAAGQMLF